MYIESIHDKETLFQYLKSNIPLQLYLIGDLDSFFWPKTTWYALREEGRILSLALFYIGQEMPTLLLFQEEGKEDALELLRRLKNYLPVRFNAHISPGLVNVFGRENILQDYGYSYKMALRKKAISIEDENIKTLKVEDIKIIQELYSIAYPQNWFDARMLQTGFYKGYFIEGELAGIAGVHVYSAAYKVAALGNIATHPDYRGRQIAYKLTSALCVDLQAHVSEIGLNVKAANPHALQCYQKVGFEIIGEYDECLIRNG